MRILALGAVGLSLAAGVGVAVSHLAGQQIGLAGEPLRDVRQLAPPQAVTTTASRQRSRPTKAPRTTTVPVSTPAPAPARRRCSAATTSRTTFTLPATIDRPGSRHPDSERVEG